MTRHLDSSARFNASAGQLVYFPKEDVRRAAQSIYVFFLLIHWESLGLSWVTRSPSLRVYRLCFTKVSQKLQDVFLRPNMCDTAWYNRNMCLRGYRTGFLGHTLNRGKDILFLLSRQNRCCGKDTIRTRPDDPVPG
ncbi:hypothetical protein H2248_009039 [Termitomyces sp. 'cryptogamus']|nr:hypothetical protein H2248_009039 [Termitomyces sp. 'cryptogamus']